MAGSSLDSLCRGKSQSPVVRIAEEMETEPSKPIDKISRGENTSHRAVSRSPAEHASLTWTLLRTKNSQQNPKQPLDRKSPIQVRIRCEPDADRGARDRGDALSVQSFAALDSVIGGQFIKYLRNPPAQLGSLK